MWVCPTGERGVTDSVTQSLPGQGIPSEPLVKFSLSHWKSLKCYITLTWPCWPRPDTVTKVGNCVGAGRLAKHLCLGSRASSVLHLSINTYIFHTVVHKAYQSRLADGKHTRHIVQ